MTILDAIILGLVEGITEYLPVSSTGHLIITAWLLGLDKNPESSDAVNAFTIIIQGGAILAVLGLYFARVRSMLKGVIGRDAAGRRLLVNIIIAFIPAVVFGLLLEETIDRYLFHPVPVLVALAAGGLVLIGWDRFMRGSGDEARAHIDLEQLTPGRALLIGLLQCVAMWPGTSRSMMTILGGMLVGLRARQAAEFSFLLGLPTLGGACAWKTLKIITSEDGGRFVEDLGGWGPMIVGIVVATVSAALAIKWLVGYLSTHGMALFGWWRLALSAIVLGLVISGNLTFGQPPEESTVLMTDTTAQEEVGIAGRDRLPENRAEGVDELLDLVSTG
ncbi:MAG: UDP-diphosphatase [Phycisphaerae bacterium]|nr:UDP-diphosphatase [Phycisphaerae bacterium]